MKQTRCGLTFLALALAVGSACAEGTKRSETKPLREARAVITGSNIPERPARSVRRDTLTRPTGPVVILTSTDIQRIGARDLADALRRGTAIAH